MPLNVLAETINDSVSDLKQGITLYQQQHYKKAVKVFKQLHERYPEHPIYLNNLAVAQVALGEFDAALKSLQQAMNTHKDYAVTQKNISSVYAYMAAEAYNKALDDAKPVSRPELELLTELPQIDSTNNPLDLTKATDETIDVVNEQSIQDVLEQQTKNWIQAWSKTEVEDYLDHYSNRFQPPDNQSFQEWQSQRRFRLQNPGNISISYNQLKVYTDQEQQYAIVEFIQDYNSGRYQDKVRKQLHWILEDGHWRIVREDVIQKL